LRDLAIAWGSSILTRSDESSLDLMQACIVGPRDTPYANALLFFDLSIPSDYPQSNPKCKITSTGGGAVRFNANLYADGKVRALPVPH
jgi:baculoviral IAP repeat-containing protein 6